MGGPVIVRQGVPAHLREFVAGIVGYDESAGAGGVRRAQPASSLAILEISFTNALVIRGAAQRGFFAGIAMAPIDTHFHGRHASVQVYFTPLGACRLVMPGRDSANNVVALSDLDPVVARDVPDALAAAATWPERFAVVENMLTARVHDARPLDPIAAAVWTELRRSGGRAPIAGIAEKLGVSARHVHSRFGAVVGVSPKSAAQLMRFERAHGRLGGAVPLAEMAASLGYADQSHLAREVRRFSGDPPRVLADAARPTAFTAIGIRA